MDDLNNYNSIICSFKNTDNKDKYIEQVLKNDNYIIMNLFV